MPKPGRGGHQKRLPAIEGTVPSLFNLPQGCRFADRCQHRRDNCEADLPDLVSIGEGMFESKVRCFYPIGDVEEVGAAS
jgi:oligopeptide/dipeptide ABC transporter ATP-binding protein